MNCGLPWIVSILSVCRFLSRCCACAERVTVVVVCVCVSQLRSQMRHFQPLKRTSIQSRRWSKRFRFLNKRASKLGKQNARLIKFRTACCSRGGTNFDITILMRALKAAVFFAYNDGWTFVGWILHTKNVTRNNNDIHRFSRFSAKGTNRCIILSPDP